MRLQVAAGRQDARMQTLVRLATGLGISIESVSRATLDALAGNQHQGVVACCHPAAVLTEADLPAFLEKITGPPFLLVLDGIQDPHNLGACLRSADAAGVHAVILPKDRTAPASAVAARAAAGAMETVPLVRVTNLARTLAFLKQQGIWLYGASEKADRSLYDEKLSGATAIVLGAEGKGLRRLTAGCCDVLLHIPLQGSVSSLNVSVAAGIFLFEVVRQKQAR